MKAKMECDQTRERAFMGTPWGGRECMLGDLPIFYRLWGPTHAVPGNPWGVGQPCILGLAEGGYLYECKRITTKPRS